jgi:hypothetical protein
MRYAFLDTNIYIRVITQGQPGCEIECLEDLTKLIADGRIQVLLPEVVELEYTKHWHSLQDEIESGMSNLKAQLEAQLPKMKVWNELGDVQKTLLESLPGIKDEKLKKSKENHKKVQLFLSLHSLKRIPLTNELLLATRKRVYSGRMPAAEKIDRVDRDGDVCIVESLLHFFRETKDKKAELFLCCENVADFAVELPNKKGSALHPMLAEELPKPTHFFTNLKSLVDVIRKDEKVEEPSPQEVQKAVEEDREKRAVLQEAAAVRMSALDAIANEMDRAAKIPALQVIANELNLAAKIPALQTLAEMNLAARMPALEVLSRQITAAQAVANSLPIDAIVRQMTVAQAVANSLPIDAIMRQMTVAQAVANSLPIDAIVQQMTVAQALARTLEGKIEKTQGKPQQSPPNDNEPPAERNSK